MMMMGMSWSSARQCWCSRSDLQHSQHEVDVFCREEIGFVLRCLAVGYSVQSSKGEGGHSAVSNERDHWTSRTRPGITAALPGELASVARVLQSAPGWCS